MVAYDIPALRIHYGNNPGAGLVEEGDVEALVTGALNLLESRDIVVEQPALRTWSDIVKEEVELVRRLVEHG